MVEVETVMERERGRGRVVGSEWLWGERGWVRVRVCQGGKEREREGSRRGEREVGGE